MNESSPHISIEQAQPSIDFVCCWRREGSPWYQLRVPSHQFILLDEGRITARGAGALLHATAGDLLCLGRTARSEYGYEGKVRYWETHAAFGLPQRLPLWIDGRPIPELLPMGEHAAAARRAFELMCLSIDRAGDCHRARVRSAMFDLLAAIAAALGRSGARARRNDPWMRARLALDSTFAESLSLAHVAADLDLSENHFIRGFRRRFGMTPMAYRSQARLRAGADALAESGASVKEIAAQLGFADASVFARAFRRQFGATPSTWRDSNTQAQPRVLIDGDAPFPLNRHIRPPECGSGNYRWG